MSQCQFTATATPPDSAGGWTAQFKRRQAGTTVWSNHGSKDPVSPYVGVAKLNAGDWEFQVVWTKSGQTSQTSPVSAKGCQ